MVLTLYGIIRHYQYMIRFMKFPKECVAEHHILTMRRVMLADTTIQSASGC